MSNELKRALGGLNNPEFIFDPQGKIVRLRDWSSPTRLRADLEELVGPVANPTNADELNLQFQTPTRAAAHGIVPRIAVPDHLQGVKVTPKIPGGDKKGNPHHVKLRAEADESLLETGKGKLYLGFHLDPVHHVHWNNLVDPIEFEIKTREGTVVSPSSGKGPKISVEADIDPREFLVDVHGGDAGKPLELTVHYFACNDEEGWCKPVTQSYVIHLERDRNALGVGAREWGSGRGPGGRRFAGPPRGPGRGGPPPGGGPPGGFSVETLFRFDRNGDGKVSKDELPEFLRERILDRADTNKDGMIEKQEAENLFK